MSDLRVTLVQPDLNWEDKSKNLHLLAHLTEENISGTDLIILPEMFTTGFSMSPEKFAEQPDGKTVNWMKDRAKQFNAAVTGSAIIEENGSFYNRLIWAEPDGKVVFYDKRHCFSYAGEEKHYTPGKERITIQYKGWKILPQVCYDLRFPVWSRNSDDYDFAFYVANWPERRSYAWKQLLIARAIENQCYVAGLNRVGLDGNKVNHSGDSMILSPQGKPIERLTPGKEDVSTVKLSKEELQKVRKRFAFLNDRDQFEIKL